METDKGLDSVKEVWQPLDLSQVEKQLILNLKGDLLKVERPT